MKVKRACIFAHFDSQNILDQYVLAYLNALLPLVDRLVFISASKLSEVDHATLYDMGIESHNRENTGYDFFSWRDALSRIDLDEFDELLQVNDSCYAPMFDLARVFEIMSESECDFWGMTKSYHIRKHLQSFFVCYRKPVLMSAAYHQFWQSLTPLTAKNDIVRQYEIGLTQVLLGAGFKMDQFFKLHPSDYFKRLPGVLATKFPGRRNLNPYKYIRGMLVSNPTFYHYDEMLKQKVPLLKVGLIKNNQIPIVPTDLNSVPGINKEMVRIIKDHQTRLGQGELAKAWTG